MAVFYIKYHTENKYENWVNHSFFSLLILPSEDKNQKRLSFNVKNSQLEPFFLQKNLYGFEQIIIRPDKPFNALTITVDASVKMEPINSFETVDLPIKLEKNMLASSEFKFEHYSFLTQTSKTTLNDKSIIASLFMEEKESCFNFLLKINDFIYHHFKFLDSVNSLERDANTTWVEKTGVCQDFTHLFIAICRINGIPARYVSGYLNQGENYTGTAVMHAWCEAFVPNRGWIGFDPTNNLVRNQNHIKVCHGQDYQDCAPIKGILNTTGNNTTQYYVVASMQQQQQQ